MNEAVINAMGSKARSLGLNDIAEGIKWEAMLADLKRFKDRFDDCNVPMGAENPQTGEMGEQTTPAATKSNIGA